MIFTRYYFALASLILPIIALPVKRQDNNIDLTVLQFANVLEQLETEFYSQALSKFQPADFTAAGYTDPQIPIQQFKTIQSDESTHTSGIQQAIIDAGAQPLKCSFDFSKVLTDVSTMATTARVVEMVGVSAYLGAANLITNPQLLTIAGSILTVEARHQTMLNVMNGVGAAIPQAFDIALSPSQVLAIAGGFIQPGCDVGVPANLPLALTNTGTVGVGSSLSFDTSALPNSDPNSLFCQMLVGGAPMTISQPLSNCIVPDISGPVAIFITNNSQPLANDQTIQFAQEIVMGPAMTFIDKEADTIMSVIKSGSGSQSTPPPPSDQSSQAPPPPSSTDSTSPSSTNTITPEEASSLIAEASSTVAGAPSPTDTSSSNLSSGGGPSVPNTNDPTSNTATDGNTIVIGWSSAPAPQPAAAA